MINRKGRITRTSYQSYAYWIYVYFTTATRHVINAQQLAKLDQILRPSK